MSEKMIQKVQNKAGKWYAMTRKENGNYAVYSRSVNYSQGKNIATWGFVVPRQKMTFAESSKISREGMSQEVATKIFNRKIEGKQK